MEHKNILLAGVVAAALFSISTTAIAGSYDDQTEETRALNIQALAAAQGQNGAPMVDLGGVEADQDHNGVGGPLFEVPPGPDDLGDEPTDGNDLDDAIDPQDMPPSGE